MPFFLILPSLFLPLLPFLFYPLLFSPPLSSPLLRSSSLPFSTSLFSSVVNPAATQEEIEAVVASGDTQIFASSLLDNRKHTQAKDALAYIQHKHRDILLLEESVRELHDLFVDMYMLVETQGEMMNEVEHNVQQSAAFVREATAQLETAKRYQSRRRKVSETDTPSPPPKKNN